MKRKFLSPLPGLGRIEHFHQCCSVAADGVVRPAAFLSFGFVSAQSQGSFEPAPSPKPRQNSKILAPPRHIISVNTPMPDVTHSWRYGLLSDAAPQLEAGMLRGLSFHCFPPLSTDLPLSFLKNLVFGAGLSRFIRRNPPKSDHRILKNMKPGDICDMRFTIYEHRESETSGRGQNIGREPKGASTVWREALELEEGGELKMAKNAAGPEAGTLRQARGACKVLKIKGRQVSSSLVKPLILKNKLRSQKYEESVQSMGKRQLCPTKMGFRNLRKSQ